MSAGAQLDEMVVADDGAAPLDRYDAAGTDPLGLYDDEALARQVDDRLARLRRSRRARADEAQGLAEKVADSYGRRIGHETATVADACAMLRRRLAEGGRLLGVELRPLVDWSAFRRRLGDHAAATRLHETGSLLESIGSQVEREGGDAAEYFTAARDTRTRAERVRWGRIAPAGRLATTRCRARQPRRLRPRRTGTSASRGDPPQGDDDPPHGQPPPGRAGEGQGGGGDPDRVGDLRRAGREAGIRHASDWLDRLADRWRLLARAAWCRVRGFLRHRMARAGRRPSTGWGRA